MAELRRSGVQLVAEGINRFLSDLDRAAQAELGLGRAAETAARPLEGLGDAAKGAGKGLEGLGKGEAVVRNVASGVIEFAGALGIATTATGAAMAVFDQFKQGVDIRRQIESNTASLALFVGGQAKANSAMQEAQRFGAAYAFSQREIATAMQALGPLLNQSTAAVGKQLEVYSRLATLNPAEGLQGAAFAIAELASGDIVSLNERFRVAKDTAYQMRDAIASGADIVTVLDQYLTNAGVTAQALENRTAGLEGNFNRAAAATERMQLALAESSAGDLYGQIVEGAATGAAAVVTLGDDVTATSAKLLEGSKSYDDYNSAAEAVNGALAGITGSFENLGGGLAIIGPLISGATNLIADMGGQVPSLTEAQYALAQSFIASGMGAAEALAKVQALAPMLTQLEQVQGVLATRSNESAAAFGALAPRIMAVASSGAYGQAAMTNLSNAVMYGTMTDLQFANALGIVEQRIAAASVAAAANTGATNAQAAATTEAAIALQQAEIAALNEMLAKEASAVTGDMLAASQNALMAAAQNAAAGQGTAESAAAALAAQFGVEEAKAYSLISALRQLSQFQNTGISMNASPSASRLMRDEMVGNQGRPLTAQQIKEQREANAAIAKANADAKKLREDNLRASQAAARATRGGGGGRAGGGGGGGGGAAKEVAAAAKSGESLVKIKENTAQKLQEIARNAGERLLQIDQDAQQKLVAIDQRAAAERVKIAQQLANEIAKSNAATEASFQLNDIGMYAEEQTEEQQRQLAAREQAEVNYRQRVAAAQQEAQRIAAEGDAEYAREYLASKVAEAQGVMDIEQQAAEARANVSGENAAALETEIAEAVAAREQQTQTDIALAQAASDQRQQAIADEKAKVITDAAAQSAEVIAAAQKSEYETIESAKRSAEGVKGATADMVSSTVAGWQAVAGAADAGAEAVNRYADAVRNAPGAPSSGGGSGGGSTGPTAAGGGGTFVAGRGAGRSFARAAGGGSFLADRQMKVTVGEDGPEMLHVVPLFSGGATKVGSGWARMAGGGSGIAGMGQNRYMGGSGFDLSGIDPTNLDAALSQLEQIVKIIDAAARRSKMDTGIADKFSNVVRIVSETLQAIATLRESTRRANEPIDLTGIDAMLADLVHVTVAFNDALGKQKLNLGILGAFAEGIGSAMDIIFKMIEIRERFANAPAAAPSEDLIRQLAAEARVMTRIIQEELLKLWQEERDALALGAEALESANSMYSSVLDIRDAFADPGPPLLLERLQQVAAESRMVVDVLQGSLIPLTDQEVTDLEAVASGVQAVADTFGAILGLRSDLKQPQSPIVPADLDALVADTAAVAAAAARLVPEGFKVVAGVEEYADLLDRATTAFQQMVELRASLRTIAPPIDVYVLGQLSAELRRLIMYFQADVIPYGHEMLEGINSYSAVAEQATDRFLAMSDLRVALATAQPPIDLRVLEQLSAELYRGVIYFQANVIPYSEEMRESVDSYSSVAQQTIDAFLAVIDLGANISAAVPIPLPAMQRLAAETMGVVGIFTRTVMPISEQLSERADRYAGIVDNAVGSLEAAANLGQTLTDSVPIRMDLVQRVAAETMGVAGVFTRTIIKYAEQTAENAERYAGIVDSSISSISSVATLGASLRDMSPIPINVVLKAADDAQRIAGLFVSRLIPATQEQADAAERAATIVGDSTGALSDVLAFGGDLWANYQSPSDAMLDLAVADAHRFMQRMHILAAVYKGEGADAIAATGNAITSVAEGLSSIKTMVLSLQPGSNFTMDAAQVAAFETSATMLMDTAGRVGAVAAGISPDAVGALPVVAGAITSVFEALAAGGRLMGGGVTMPSMPIVQPAMTPTQIHNTYYAYDNSQNVTIGSVGSGVNMAQVKQAVREVMNESGRTAYTRRATR